MNWRLAIVICAVAASAALCVTMRQRETAELRALIDKNRSATQELANLQAENQKMSSSVDKAESAAEMSQGKLAELMRLRASVTKLRAVAREKPRLETSNARLRSLVDQKTKPADAGSGARN